MCNGEMFIDVSLPYLCKYVVEIGDAWIGQEAQTLALSIHSLIEKYVLQYTYSDPESKPLKFTDILASLKHYRCIVGIEGRGEVDLFPI